MGEFDAGEGGTQELEQDRLSVMVFDIDNILPV